jgi:hypothetical protein
VNVRPSYLLQLILAVFPASLLFNSLYEQPLVEAIRTYSAHLDFQEAFINQLRLAFCNRFGSLVGSEPPQDVIQFHREELFKLRPQLTCFNSQRLCLCCFMYTPEKILDCEHAVCDNCVKTFGTKSCTEPYSYCLSYCPLCDKPHSRTFRFIPPTAGIRVLSLDGGGIRAVVSLTTLSNIERDLSYLQIPLWDCFDYVIGTSSGGLTSMGIFLMHWTAEDCLKRFYELSRNLFAGSSLPKYLDHAQNLLLLCMDKAKYNQVGIKAAFQSALGTPPQMFNPLATDAKVAVLTTTVESNKTIVLCNYNGDRARTHPDISGT